MNPSIQPAPLDAVREIRRLILRPFGELSDCVFDGDDLPGTRHLGAVLDGVLVGVESFYVRDPEGRPDPAWRQLRGMAVLKPHQGCGIGKALLGHALAELDREGVQVWCNARVAVEPFYQAFGFTRLGGIFDIPGVGPHLRMWRQI